MKIYVTILEVLRGKKAGDETQNWWKHYFGS
jgi:hypothetical protein